MRALYQVTTLIQGNNIIISLHSKYVHKCCRHKCKYSYQTSDIFYNHAIILSGPTDHEYVKAPLILTEYVPLS